MSNEQNVDVVVPPGTTVLIVKTEASAVVTRADGTIKEE